MKIKNPRTGQYYYEIFPLSFDELKSKTIGMRKAQIPWKEFGIDQRIAVLKTWSGVIIENRDRLIDALCMDTGRKWETILEVDSVLNLLEEWGVLAKNFFLSTPIKTGLISPMAFEQDYEPMPLVGVISPWNSPFLLSLVDTIPALLAGCAVVVKPSEVTPRFIEVIQKTINQVPDLLGVLNYVEGAGQTGEDLCKLTDLICFTGSTATGRKVYQSASENFIPVYLELGGKDAAIVTETADIERATSEILWGCVANAGQSCVSIERIYVHRNVYHQFLSRLVGKANLLQLAYPSMDSGQIGPIISEKQAFIINNQLAEALKKGATLKTGLGRCEELGGGQYCRPTILTNVTHEMKVMTEETLGPILPVMVYNSTEQAVEFANYTEYGLSGSVFAGTEEEAWKIARKMNCRTVFINHAAQKAFSREEGRKSLKMSDIGGDRLGLSAFRRFMKQKTYIMNPK